MSVIPTFIKGLRQTLARSVPNAHYSIRCGNALDRATHCDRVDTRRPPWRLCGLMIGSWSFIILKSSLVSSSTWE
jgi:hypothetical protein